MEHFYKAIKRDYFDSELYDGYMFHKNNFLKHFPLNNGTTKECFEKANTFLVENGYSELSFEEFVEELTITKRNITLYADPYIVDNGYLILVVTRAK